jgi:hypothetical protein
MSASMRIVRAARWAFALKTGSSLPIVVDDDEGARWIVKMRGAGGGTRALACEALYAALADVVDVPVPRRAVVEVEEGLLADGDPEILDLIRASRGANLGFEWIEGAKPFVLGRTPAPLPTIASRVLALDTMLLNVDRTLKNANVLVSPDGKSHWFVDHGALLLFEHAPGDAALAEGEAIVRGHLFADLGARFEPEALRLVILSTETQLDAVLSCVPDTWLDDNERARFRAVLRARRDRWQRWRASARDSLR